MLLLTRLLGGRETLAAGVLTLGWMVLVAAPLVWLGLNLADHVRDAVAFVKDVQVDGLPEAPSWLAGVPLVGERLVGIWNTIDEQGAALMVAVKPYLGQVGNWLLARSAQIGSGILELTLSILFVFFFYRDGPRLAAFVLSLLERLIGERAGYYQGLVAGTVQRVVNGVIGRTGPDRLPDRRGAGCTGAGVGDLSAQPDPHGTAAGVDSSHGLAGLEGRVRYGGVPRHLGHVHHQWRGQRTQAVPDQPGRQFAIGGGVAGRLRRFDQLRFYRSVYRPHLVGGGLQPAARLECEPGEV